MDSFLKTKEGFETTLKLIDSINRTTDDYLFIWDIPADRRWFFGDIDRQYDVRKNGSETNSTDEMMRIIYESDRSAVRNSLGEIARGEKDTHNMDYRWVNRKGERVWINCHGKVIRDGENKPYLMIGRASEENLRHLYNPLTTLWNKTRLLADLRPALERSRGYIMQLDVDALAAINYAHGREYGNRILRQAAEVFERAEGVSCAYHVDHNDFVLLVDVQSGEEVQTVYDNIRSAMSERCTFTAGAVPVDRTLFLDEAQLLDALSMTTKRAKEFSGDRIELFSPQDMQEKLASLDLLEELKTSVEHGCENFEVHYQPQLRAESYVLHGVEALLRYDSKTRGRIFPDVFIPLLERSGLIKTVGLWVLKVALRQCRIWREKLPELKVSVNFSAVQFEDAQLSAKILAALEEEGLSGEALTVEITETVELVSSRTLTSTVRALKANGVGVAIDDFGTGYANLGYLKQLEVDEIKIDRIFVSGIETNTYNHKLVSNVIEFAKSNNIRTCCEGVEKMSELAVLETLLPNAFQGYLFDRPGCAEYIESAYVDTTADAYRQRLELLGRIADYKDRVGIIHFDPKDILKENGVGLWIMRMHGQDGRRELYVDETMEGLLGRQERGTPEQCYSDWAANVHPDFSQYVEENIEKMLNDGCSVQIEFPWLHHRWGEVMVRMCGRRVKSTDKRAVLEGYYRIITDMTGA